MTRFQIITSLICNFSRKLTRNEESISSASTNLHKQEQWGRKKGLSKFVRPSFFFHVLKHQGMKRHWKRRLNVWVPIVSEKLKVLLNSFAANWVDKSAEPWNERWHSKMSFGPPDQETDEWMIDVFDKRRLKMALQRSGDGVKICRLVV